jgi:hypothetical protein
MESEWADELEVKDDVYEVGLVEKMLPWRFFCAADGAGTKSWLEWTAAQMRKVVGRGEKGQNMVGYMIATVERAALATFTEELFNQLRAVAPKNFVAGVSSRDPLAAEAERKEEKYEELLGELKALKESDKRLDKEMEDWLELLEKGEVEEELDRRVSDSVTDFIREVEEYLDAEDFQKFPEAGVAEIDFFPSLRKKNDRAKAIVKKEFEAITEYKRGIEKSVDDGLGMYEDIYEENVADERYEENSCYSANSSPAPNSAKTQRSPFFSRAFLARSSMAVLREETR